MIMHNSPNVTFVDNTPIRTELYPPIENLTATIHGEVVVIDIHDTFIDTRLGRLGTKMFSRYSDAGHVYPVGRTGLATDEGIGSERLCTNSSKLAQIIDVVIRESDAFPAILSKDAVRNTLNNKTFAYSGVSPYFRFMRYTNGGEHYPHYDSDYKYDYGGIVTKYSLVLYLTSNCTGELVFVRDPRGAEFFGTDWDRQFTEDEVILRVKPRAGRIVLFPHTLCHAVDKFQPSPEEGQERMVIRGDVEFVEV